jgi:hypothetical protein
MVGNQSNEVFRTCWSVTCASRPSATARSLTYSVMRFSPPFSFQSRLQRIVRVGCSELPIGVISAMNADLFVSDLQPTAVDFDKLRDSAAHFDQIAEDCGRTNRYISMSTAVADFGK